MEQYFYDQKAALEKKVTELCTEFALAHKVNIEVEAKVYLNIARACTGVIAAAVNSIDINMRTTS